MLKLYNTLTRKKEVFKPIKDKQVGIYTCGPTVYNHAHIGNLRAYIFADLLQRYLKYSGYKVRWVMNITDVDDKTIRDSRKAKKSLKSFTRYYEKIFFKDILKLNITKDDLFRTPRATEHIKEMQKIIRRLLKNGLAYEKSGSIYFSIKRYIEAGHRYGRLLNIDLERFKGERVDLDEYEKEDIKDFALWKKSKKGEPSWDFKIGENNFVGRPGWHIECSAMSSKYLGQPFDIHTGGVDLIFPHHEDEIAQSEGANGKKFANFFVHNDHLLVDGHKMAKSLKNFYTLEDVEKMVGNVLALRYFYLQAHYRSKQDFTKESLKAAENTLENIFNFIRRLLAVKEKRGNIRLDFKLLRRRIIRALEDDLNIPEVLAILHTEMTNLNNNFENLGEKEAKKFLDLLFDLDKILGLGFRSVKIEKLPIYIKRLIKKREQLRAEKEFEEADRIRGEVLKLGYELEDTPQGTMWKKIR